MNGGQNRAGGKSVATGASDFGVVMVGGMNVGFHIIMLSSSHVLCQIPASFRFS